MQINVTRKLIILISTIHDWLLFCYMNRRARTLLSLPPPRPCQVQPSLTTQQHFLKTKQVTNLVRKLSNAFHQVLIGLPISSNHMSHYWYNIKGIFIIGTVSSKSNM